MRWAEAIAKALARCSLLVHCPGKVYGMVMDNFSGYYAGICGYITTLSMPKNAEGVHCNLYILPLFDGYLHCMR